MKRIVLSNLRKNHHYFVVMTLFYGWFPTLLLQAPAAETNIYALITPFALGFM